MLARLVVLVMTLVLQLHVNKVPVLIGDVLVSNSTTGGRAVRLPSLGLVQPVPSVDFAPEKLTQKLAVLDQNLAIGWSGDLHAARMVCNDIRAELSRRPFTQETFLAYMHQIPEDIGRAKLSLVACLREGNRMGYFSGGQVKKQARGENSIAAIGSGSMFLDEMMPELLQVLDRPQGPPHVVEAIGCGLQTAGGLLARELVIQDTLLKHFGGGFELVTIGEDGFEKLPNVIHLVWAVRLDEGVWRMTLGHAAHYFYIRDVLLIHSLELYGATEDNRIKAVRNDLIAVPPVYRELSLAEMQNVPPPDWTAPWVCSYFVLTSHPAAGRYFSDIAYSADGKHPVSISQSAEGLTVRLSRELADHVVLELGEGL